MTKLFFKNLPVVLAFLFVLASFSSCASIKRGVLNSIGKMFTQGGEQGNAFTRDSDPVLVEAALPSFLKMTELMRDAAPDSPDLNFGAGQIAVMYAGGFLQPKLEQLESFSEKKKLIQRTKAMYLRGRDSIMNGLRQRYIKKGFDEKLRLENLDEFLAMMTEKDLPFLYWGGLSWLGAFALDPFDFALLASISQPILLLWRAMQLNAEYAKGSLHTSMINVMGSLPNSQVAEAMSHSPELVKPFFNAYYERFGVAPKNKRAITRHHFKESLRLSQGQDPSVYVAMANWLRRNQTNPAEAKKGFREYLDKALEIDIGENVSNRLMILLYQQQASYLLENIDIYFL